MRSLAGVAVTAQHLQVVRLVGAAFRYWVNVVYLKSGTILGRNSAHLAAIVVTLQNLKAQARLDCLALCLGFGFGVNSFCNFINPLDKYTTAN